MVLDSEAEPIFDTLARLASEVCQTPIALLSLVDTNRQWFKANVGLEGVRETTRDVSFCDHAIRSAEVLEVPDARSDPRFQDNPLVLGSPNIRFYAGAPLVTASGDRIGTLCVIDHQAKHLSAEQTRTLQELALAAVQALEMRERSVRESLRARSAHEHELDESESRHRAILDAQSELVSQSDAEGTLLYVNPAYASFFGRTVDDLIGSSLFDMVSPADVPTVRARIQEVLSGGGTQTSENRMVSPTATERWVSWTNTRQVGANGAPLLHSTGRDISIQVQAQRELAQSRALLARTGRVAGVGGWQLDIVRRRLRWTEETRRIHEVPPDYEPTLEDALAFYGPESKSQLQAAVERGMADGTPWDLELLLHTANGQPRWVRAVGEVEFEEGRAIRMFGALQDISSRREAEAELKAILAIFTHTTDFVIQADHERRVCYMNPAAAQAILGRPWTSADTPFVRELLPESTQQKFAREILPALATQDTWIGQSEAYLANGKLIPVSHMVIAHRDGEGGIGRFSIMLRDISELAAAEAERERQAATLRSVADAIPSTVAVVNREGNYAFVNSAFQQDIGLTEDQILGQPASKVLGADEFERRKPWFNKALSGEGVRFDHAVTGPRGGRHLAMEYLPLRSPSGEADGFVVVGQDITETFQERVRLQALSLTDALTQLLNRAGFEQRVTSQLMPDGPSPLAVLFLDLDRFKQVNDSHGHGTGDELLKLVAKRLQRLVRPSDTVARLGGDEFVVALHGAIDEAQVRRVAETMVEALGRPFQLDRVGSVEIGASVGAVIGQATRANWGDLVTWADQQLYVAKGVGRGRVALSTAPGVLS